MGGECKQQCETNCQVWHLAVSGESNPTHMHMPCLPGGGRPGGGLQFRTYEGGCRSACSGSVRHPVQHLYPAGRMRKWLLDTKEWFCDGMFVMKTENPTKSASHYCLPFPRPTMRLPRVCNSRLVEVHHIHPPPAQSGTKLPQNPDGNPLPPQTPLQEGSEGQSEIGNGVHPVDSQSLDQSASEASKDGQKPRETSMANETHETATEKKTMPNSSKAIRVSHIDVTAGSPPPANSEGTQHHPRGGKDKNPDHPSELTFVCYIASLCSRICGRQRCCQGTPGCFPCVPARCKFWVQRGVAFCFSCMASACLCFSSSCTTLSFCIRNMARNLDVVASTAVDVKELANCYVFLADMPGLKYSDIKVQVENNNVLKISGNQVRDDFVTGEEIKYILVERNNGGRFIRKFHLPAHTNLNGISAACQDGLLTVIVPRNPQPDPLGPRSFDVDVHSVTASPRQTTPSSPPNPR